MKVSERRVRPRALSHVRSLNSYRIFQLMIGGALLCLIEGPCRVDGEYVGRSLQPIPSRSRIQMPIIKGLESVVLVPRGGDISPSAISSSSSATSLLETLSDKPWKCWAFLFVSILTENVAASMIKAARVKKSFSLLAVACSWYLLGNIGFFVAMEKIELGIAYAIWSAIGTTIVTLVGIVYFGEDYDWQKIACLLLIVMGVAGLNLRDEH